MKADISRYTFDPRKRYSGVLMQQGRVQLDSEWNEQQEIHQHRAQTGTGDAIGPSGTPIAGDGRATGFEITAKNGKLCLGAGHLYVEGVLCVNETEREISYDDLPDPPNCDDLTKWMEDDDGLKLGLVYLDVWERHVTHFDDERIREVALGGPDTTTRKQTVWQIKVMKLDARNDDDEIEFLTEYAGLRARYDELREKQEQEAARKTRRRSKKAQTELEELEKELEDTQERLRESSIRAEKVLGSLCKRGEQKLDDLKKTPRGQLSAWTKEQKGATDRCQVPPGGGYERLENQLYRVEIHNSGNRNGARFKWSRDNGSVATGIKYIDHDKREITVRDAGRDEYLRFANGQWVEVVDDRTELQGKPRKLLRVKDVVGRTVVVEQTPPDWNAVEAHHPKLRRWDQRGADSKLQEGLKLDEQELEDGIEVEFFGGEYQAGDYWLIPARTATGDIEWPLQDDGKTPEPQSPHGVRHGFCALAIVAAVSQDDDGDDEYEDSDKDSKSRLAVLRDCRDLFPQLTRLTSFFYLGGDGQEAMPGAELLEPLRVGVANGQWPVQGARVRFETDNGALKNKDRSSGQDEDGNPDDKAIIVLTDAQGVAACRWKLDGTNQSQQVTATLLGAEDDVENRDDENGSGVDILHLPIHFSANMSVASNVYYDPGDCANLREADNVQKAIDKISALTSLYYLSGDGQHVPPDEVGELDQLEVLVANDCGPVKDARVEFTVVQGNGTLEDPNVTTDEHGVASCRWTLDAQTPVQRVKAQLDEEALDDTRGPSSFVFTATLNRGQARHTSYDPDRCDNLREAGSVQDAIDALCQNSALHYLGGDGQAAMPGEDLQRPLRVRAANGRWPLENARVMFEARAGTLQNGDATFETETGSDGVAESTWRLGSDPDESHEVEAYLLDRDGERVEPPVRFGADVSVASRVAYDPANCELLAETRTVQEAIDRLCRGGGGQDPEPGFHVEEVRRLIDDEPVRHGSRMPLRELLTGLRIVCDDEVEPETINRATCFVTLHLPWQLSGEERMFPNMLDMISGFQPIVIRSDPIGVEREIRWRPNVDRRFGDVLFGIPIDEPTLARLVLKGNFIHAAGRPDLYLDGDTFVDLRDEFGLRRPTGDGRRGGDFELHIWVDLPWIG